METQVALSPDTQATLLLCGQFAGGEHKAARPLTPTEYNRLAKHLHTLKLRPANLLSYTSDRLPHDVVDPERLDSLLRRGVAMALALERWNQLGIGVLGRSDDAYPSNLRSRLKSGAPPLLFVAGCSEILRSKAICIVGSRDATVSGLKFARSAGAACAAEGLAVVSGDARGVDQEAMSGALEADGRGIGILAEALGKAVLNKRHRQALMKGKVVLLSPFSPEASFTVAHAMERNKYLYCMSVAAVVVDSDVKGGTWTGAVENQKNRWVPAFVRAGEDTREGNRRLAELGLSPITEKALTLRGSLYDCLVSDASNISIPTHEEFGMVNLSAPSESLSPTAEHAISSSVSSANDVNDSMSRTAQKPADDLFSFFVSKLTPFLELEPRSEQQVADYFAIEYLQACRWLETACNQHLVRRVDDSVIAPTSNSKEQIPALEMKRSNTIDERLTPISHPGLYVRYG